MTFYPTERFGVVYDGWRYWVVDSHTQDWTRCTSKEAAEGLAAYNQYCWEETVVGRERFRDE